MTAESRHRPESSSEGPGGIARLFVRGAATTLTLRVAGAGLAFGLQVLLARLLGYEQYGEYILAFTVMVTLATILKLGFDTTTLRFVPVYRSRGDWVLLRGLLRESGRLVWTLAIGVALLSACAVAYFRVRLGFDLAWTLVIATAPLQLLTAQHLFEARLRAFDRVALARILQEIQQPLLLAVLAFAIAYWGGSLGARDAVFCAVAAAVITLLTAALAFRSVVPPRPSRAPTSVTPGSG